MPRALLVALLALLAGVVLWWSYSGPRLSDREVQNLMDWLTCDECTDGELAFVTDTLEARALPLLGEVLLADSIPFLSEAREAIAGTWSANPIPGSDSAQYVDYFAANLDAQVRKRSAAALAALGDTITLREAAEQAATLGLRDDVVAAIEEARRSAGAPGLLPLTPDRVIVRPQALAVAVGDTVSLEALGRTADSARVTGPVTWVSANPAVASVSSPDPGHGRVAGVSPGVTTIMATLGPVSAVATVTVTGAPSLPPYNVVAVSGDQQVVPPANPPGQPLVVWVHTGGTGLAGIAVTWTTTGPGMAPLPAVSVTDASGIASYLPPLGQTPGLYWVVATAGPLTVRFQIRRVP